MDAMMPAGHRIVTQDLVPWAPAFD